MKLQDLSEDVLALGGATSEVKMEAGFRIYGQFYVKYESAEVRRHSRVQSTVVVHYQKMENVLLRILNTTSYVVGKTTTTTPFHVHFLRV